MSCVDPQVLQGLSLPVLGVIMTNMPAVGGWLTTIQRNAGLRVLHPSADPDQDLVVADLTIAEVPLGVLGYDLLLGRDVLQQCRFVYDGLADEFELMWK